MNNKLFIDTNVMLDFLGERESFYEPAAKIMSLSDRGIIQVFTSALSFKTVNYFIGKFENKEIAKEKLRKFKVISNICNLDEITIEKGLNSSFNDFEDAIQYFCAIEADCELIITRNEKDFIESTIPVMTPVQYLESLKPI